MLEHPSGFPQFPDQYFHQKLLSVPITVSKLQREEVAVTQQIAAVSVFWNAESPVGFVLARMPSLRI